VWWRIRSLRRSPRRRRDEPRSTDWDLRGINFEGSIIKTTDFSGADLTGSRFFQVGCLGCFFDNAKLFGADLTSFYIRGASFRGADLRAARVANAELMGCDFTGSNLIGASGLESVYSWADTICPDGTRSNAADGDGTPASTT
jgi:uncharacterized protein YjbI with pentapeptide repeats